VDIIDVMKRTKEKSIENGITLSKMGDAEYRRQVSLRTKNLADTRLGKELTYLLFTLYNFAIKDTVVYIQHENDGCFMHVDGTRWPHLLNAKSYHEAIIVIISRLNMKAMESLMKKSRLSAAIILAMSVFAVTEVVADDWVGSYAGLQAGYTWGDADTHAYWDPPTDPRVFSLKGFDVDGFGVGIFAGHNWRVNNDVLLGVEAEGNWSSADDKITVYIGGPDFWGAEVEKEWDASLRLRVGKDMGDYMPYITGGIAWAGVKTHGFRSWVPMFPDKNKETLTGWTIGAGVEKKINENLNARIQYRYSEFDDEKWNIDPGNDIPIGEIEYHDHMLNVGLSYRF